MKFFFSWVLYWFVSQYICGYKHGEQFISYQLLVITQGVHEKCGLQNEDDVYCIDDLWSYLATLKTPGSNNKEF